MRRHELDVFSLVTGLVFVLVSAGHLLDEASQLDVDGRWVVPLVMVAIGVAGLAGLVRGRDTRPADAVRPDEPGTIEAGRSVPDDGTDETLVLHRDEPEQR